MKKVLFVATVVKLHIMVFHIPYLKWFKENGYEVHICAKNDYENKSECNIPYCDIFYDLPFERTPLSRNNLKTLKELKNIINLNEYDIVHCHTPMGGVLGRLASRETREKSTKVVYTAHGFHFYKNAPFINWLVYYPIERWMAKYTDVLITINKEDYHRARKFKAKKIEYIPGIGIDTEKYKNVNINREEKRKSIGVNKDDFLIISVGELNKNKNHQSIIKAIAKLKDNNINYAICGQGPLKTELKELAKKLGIEHQVKFLGFRNDIAELNAVADLFAFPSFREGLSVSLMEAMSIGLPVICSNIRGNVDLIDDNLGGYIFTPKKEEDLLKKLNLLVNNKEKLGTFGVYNKRKILKYELEEVIKKMEGIYE